MSKYRHIVIFRVKDNAAIDTADNVVQILSDLSEHQDGVESWKVNTSLDARKGTLIILESVFTNEEYFKKFQTSAAHMESGETIKHLADWWNGDYLQ